MNNLLKLSIVDAAKGLRSGAFRASDLLEACLEQAERTAHLNAWNSLYEDAARAQADAWQTLLENGVDLGPLQGIPLGLKANIDIAGQTMHAGSQILAQHQAQTHATVTSRLQQAGAIILGTTNMHEFAWGGTTANPHYGATSNPWNEAHIPAGSSGGSGVACAVRSAFGCLGTDTGGSVRLPASMNGITGLRPGIGQIPTDGVFPLAWSMDTVGPMAPSAQDCQLLYSVLSAQPIPSSSKPLAQLRIGILPEYSQSGLQPAVAQAFSQTQQQFIQLGAELVELQLNDLERAVDAAIIIDAAEPSTIHWPWLQQQSDQYGDDVRALLLAGGGISAVEYIQAQRYRSTLREQFIAAFAKVDALLMPMIPFTAPLKGANSILIGDHEESVLTGNMRFTSLPSMTAMPGISFPVGLDGDQLPIGMQLMAGDGMEHALLCWVSEYQNQHPETLQYPPIAGISS